jgi:hypothetical protein
LSLMSGRFQHRDTEQTQRAQRLDLLRALCVC